MSQTTTPSGADKRCLHGTRFPHRCRECEDDEYRRELNPLATLAKWANDTKCPLAEANRRATTYNAVAALIARNAELTAAHAATERDACLQAERANELQSRLAAIAAERDALAAENKALRDAASGLKFDTYLLTLTELREHFGGVSAIHVIQPQTLRALCDAMDSTPAAAGSPP